MEALGRPLAKAPTERLSRVPNEQRPTMRAWEEEETGCVFQL